MTDQLEVLLEDEGEEESPNLKFFNAAEIRKKRGAENEGGPRPGTVSPEEGKTPGKPALSPEEGRRAAAPVLAEIRAGGRPPTGRPPVLTRGKKTPADGPETGGRGEAAETLYGEMERARRAAGYRRESGTVWRPLERPPAGMRTPAFRDAEGLDRIFQRDARRYDGGFLWQ